MPEHLTDDGLVVGRRTPALREGAPEVLKVGEAAALLRVDEDRLIEAAQQGALPGRMICDDWRFSRAALLDWLGRAQGDHATNTESSR